jgi:lipopolysaccharide exporter
VAIVEFINPKGNLFAAGFSFLGQAVIRLGSSLLLTRILRPEAYGIVTVLLSVMFVVEMLADIGVTVFIVREPNAEEPAYLNTAWTMRLGRAVLNGVVVFAGAPLIASLYHLPELVAPIRVISLWFLIGGLESMSFPLAVRHSRARLQMYCELLATLVSTLFAVIYCYYSRTYWGMLYAILLNRLLLTLLSFRFYPESRPRLQFDAAAARSIFRYTRFTVPSGMLTLVLTQFDKVAFLRLFDLRLLGIYALASNIAGPIESLIINTCHMVLYPRCAHDFRTDPETLQRNYYTGNIKLFASILLLPAGVGGAAYLIIAVLYDPRYWSAAAVLQAFMLRATLAAFAASAEALLIAAGEPKVILVGNVFRTLWIVPACLGGYYLFGFTGFVYGAASNALPALAYYFWLQKKKGLLIIKYELYKVLFALVVAICVYLLAGALSGLSPTHRIHL